MRNRIKPETKRNARQLRQRLTAFEKLLWRGLRELNREGHHFRRQVPFRGFILDFAEHGARLVIELDGVQHDEPDRWARDLRRDRLLEREGYLVLRLHNGEVVETIDPVIEEIRRALALRKATPPTRLAPLADLPTRGRYIWDAARTRTFPHKGGRGTL